MSKADLTKAGPNAQASPAFKGWRIFTVSSNRLILEELAPLLASSALSAADLQAGPYPQLPEFRRAISTPVPSAVFIDVSTGKDAALELVAAAGKMERPVPVIAILTENDPQLILRCVRQGATEFMVRPFTTAQLETVIQKLARKMAAEGSAPSELGKIVCVMPAKGACGASTVATNLAFHAKRSGSGRVLLADLDPLTGTLSFLLKVKSSYSFLDILSRASELDTDLWKAMVTPRQGVDVLLSPEVMVDGTGELRDAAPIVDYARAHYDTTVLDAPGVYGDWCLSLAKLCDELILVTTNELPALQASQRALSYLESNKIGRWKTRIVVNRYDKDIGLSRDAIATALQSEVFHVIPSDYEAVQKSLLEGKAVPSATGLGKSFTTLGDLLGGKTKVKAPAKSGGSIASLLSLFSRTSG